MAPNGKIYCVPDGATEVLEIDPQTHQLDWFGSLSNSCCKWYGGALAPNGKIYCVPSDETTILEIDPTQKQVQTFGDLPVG